MSRRNRPEKREILPDPKYGDLIISQITNKMMYSGKKSAAEAIMRGALDRIKNKRKLGTDQSVVEFVHEVVKKLAPHVEVRSRRVGGATYQVPVEVRPVRGQQVAIRNLIEAARGRGEKTMEERLSAEMDMAYDGNGNAAKKREDTHKMADANKAFAHYRW